MKGMCSTPVAAPKSPTPGHSDKLKEASIIVNCEVTKYNETPDVNTVCFFTQVSSGGHRLELLLTSYRQSCLQLNKQDTFRARRNAFFHGEQEKF